jgi:hypothetical protein
LATSGAWFSNQYFLELLARKVRQALQAEGELDHRDASPHSVGIGGAP